MLRKPTLTDFGLTTTQYSDFLKAKDAEEIIIIDLVKREFEKETKSELKTNFGCLTLLVIVFTPVIYLVIYLIESGQCHDLLITCPFIIIYLVSVLWKSVPIISGIFRYFIKKEFTKEENENVSSQIRKSRLKKFNESYKLIFDFEEKLKSYDGDKLEARFPGITNFNFDLTRYSKFTLCAILEKEELLIRDNIEKLLRKNEVSYWLGLDGYSFEEEIAKIYRLLGYSAHVTKKSGDGGIDIILHDKESNKIVVQCKNHKKPVGVNVIRELFGVVTSNGVSKGILICSSGTTNGGVDFGRKNSIEILTVDDIVNLNKKVNPLKSNYSFNLEPKFSLKRKDGSIDASFVLMGNVYVYNDLWDSASEALKIVKLFQPISSNVFEIVHYSKEIFYFKLYSNKYLYNYKREDSIVVNAETEEIIQKPTKEECSNHFTSHKPYKKKRYNYRRWR